jgi:hypothetical protein
MQVTLRSRGARLAAVAALAALLALAGCGARFPLSGAPGNGQQAGQQAGQGDVQDASIQNAVSANQDIQDIAAVLTTVQADASVDYISQENETQP